MTLPETVEVLLKQYADPDGKVRGDNRYTYLRALAKELSSGKWTQWDVEELTECMKKEGFGKSTIM